MVVGGSGGESGRTGAGRTRRTRTKGTKDTRKGPPSTSTRPLSLQIFHHM